MSNRQSDTRGEKALGLFLDHYFYPSFCKIEGFKNIHRVFDINEQKLGADLLVEAPNGESIVIDEKAQLHYINEPRQTFAFEVSFYSEKTKDIVDGWFISDSNKTNAYVLVWIDSAKTNQLNRIVKDDFSVITVVFIEKKRIVHYLEQLGYPLKRIRKIARDLRFNQNTKYFKISEDAFVYYSKDGYDEKPINVVIKQEILWAMANGVYKVSNNCCLLYNRDTNAFEKADACNEMRNKQSRYNDLSNEYGPHDLAIDLIKEAGYEYIDMREKKGNLWIVAGEEAIDFIKKCERKGVIWNYAPNGSRTTGYRPGWYCRQ